MPAPLTTTLLAAAAILTAISATAAVIFLALGVVFELLIAFSQGVDAR